MKNTICALSTVPGISGIAVIRISGPECFFIVDKIFKGKSELSRAKTHTIHYGKIFSANTIIDDVTVSVFKNPNSYTGEDIAEISCHGNPIIVNQILDTLIINGAHHAEPGEFTKRAFLNGKIDLSQTEAITDIIHSSSVAGARTSARQLAGEFKNRLDNFRKKLLKIASLLELELDFAEEEIDLISKNDIKNHIISTIDFCANLSSSYESAQILRSGFYISIAGHPNAGKSTFFNALLKRSRAIVSNIPGTTRDYIEEQIFIDNISVKIIDTAGLRHTKDIIEIEGVRIAYELFRQSNLIIILNDISLGKNHSDSLEHSIKEMFPENEVLLVQNKIDKIDIKSFSNDKNRVYISAKFDDGIEKIRDIIKDKVTTSTDAVNDILINQRHRILLTNAEASLKNALNAIDNEFENETIAIDIRDAANNLGMITGEQWDENVLNNIFSSFCIGK